MTAKTYTIKEIYYTLQGEAFHSGRPAIFCRFSGCNLWTGREEDRHKAICQFCDTDFWGTDGLNGGKYTLKALISKLLEIWPLDNKPFVVFTGGEPALQLDSDIINALHEVDGEVAIETNGTIELPAKIDWICVSPKANTKVVVRKGNEMKIVFPQKGIDPLEYVDWAFEHLYIQPMDNECQEDNIKASIKFCKQNPQFKLSIQTHKYLDIP